tara:strand:+ start:1408 stop:1854 length:447 start_codon:yes stop_codon:yes gene_type:complete
MSFFPFKYSMAMSPGEEFISRVKLYYQYNIVFKPCAKSQGINYRQYEGFLKESKKAVKYYQMKLNIKKDELQKHKIQANKKANEDMAMVKNLMPIMGLGQPKDQLSKEQLKKIRKYCGEQWQNSLVVRTLIKLEMNDEDNDISDDLDF